LTDLERPRDLGSLLRDGLRFYFQNFWRMLVIGALVVVPAQLIVSGIGLGQLSKGFDASPSTAEQVIPPVLTVLVITPLITAMCTYALLGEGQAIQRGLDVFAAIFWPVLIALAIEALVAAVVVVPLAVAAGSAAVPTLLIPLYLLIRWYFVPQAVVVDDERGPGALRASWELTRGFTLRVVGVIFVSGLLLVLAGNVLVSPLYALAKSADSGALQLAGSIVGEVVTAPALALIAALLFFDLRARRTPERTPQ
jgi:hypothetical protein